MVRSLTEQLWFRVTPAMYLGHWQALRCLPLEPAESAPGSFTYMELPSDFLNILLTWQLTYPEQESGEKEPLEVTLSPHWVLF